MRLSRMTTRQWMITVALLALWFGLIRWGVVALFIGAAALTYVPSFAWADTVGKFWKRSDFPVTIEGHFDLALFLWSWMLSTLALFGIVFVAARIQGL